MCPNEQVELEIIRIFLNRLAGVRLYVNDNDKFPFVDTMIKASLQSKKFL